MAAEAFEILVQELRSFQTRARAMRALVAAGADALPALIGALRDPQESMRWAAAKCLADIGDRRAVGPLIQRLDASEDRSWAAEFVERLTGTHLPADPKLWRAWWAQQGGAEAESAAKAEGLPDRELIEHAISGLKAELREADGVFSIRVPLSGNRHQDVMVLTRYKDPDGSPLAIVYSACAPARGENYEWALRTNLTLPYGAIGIRDLKGEPTFVMFNTLLRTGLSPLELRKTIVTVAEKADDVEKAMTKEDRH